MSSFNNGLYTPFTPTAEAATPTPVATTPVAAAAVTPIDSVVTTTPVAAPPTTPTPIVVATTTPTVAYSPPEDSSTSLAVLSTTPLASTSTPPIALISAASTPLTSSLRPASRSNSVILSSATSTGTSSSVTSSSTSAADSTDGTSSFKISYLTPVFIIVPGLLIFALSAYFYKRHRSRHQREFIGGGGGGSGGSGKWFGGGRRNRSFEGDRAILTPEEEGGLVESRWLGNDDSSNGSAWGNNHSRHAPVMQERNRPAHPIWSSILPSKFNLRPTSSSNSSDLPPHPPLKNSPISFLSVPYSPLETPFTLAPATKSRSTTNAEMTRKSYLTHSADEHERRGSEDRGSAWGVPGRSSGMGNRGMSQFGSSGTLSQQENFENSGSGAGGGGERKSLIAGGWKWASKRYRAKSVRSTSSFGGGSEGSTRPPSLMARRNLPGIGMMNDNQYLQPGGRMEEPLSPSVYSPTMENGDSGENSGGVLDMILAESRVGHSEEALEFLQHQSISNQQRQIASFDDIHDSPRKNRDRLPEPLLPTTTIHQASRIPIDLPTTPTRIRTSPTKPTFSSAARNMGTIAPPPSFAPLRFSRESPPVQAFTSSSAQAMNRTSGSSTGSSGGSTPTGLSGTGTTPRKESNRSSALYFAQSGLGGSIPGGPMPANGMVASDSQYSISGMRGLVFDDHEREEVDDTTGSGGGAMSPGAGFRSNIDSPYSAVPLTSGGSYFDYEGSTSKNPPAQIFTSSAARTDIPLPPSQRSPVRSRIQDLEAQLQPSAVVTSQRHNYLSSPSVKPLPNSPAPSATFSPNSNMIEKEDRANQKHIGSLLLGRSATIAFGASGSPMISSSGHGEPEEGFTKEKTGGQVQYIDLGAVVGSTASSSSPFRRTLPLATSSPPRSRNEELTLTPPRQRTQLAPQEESLPLSSDTKRLSAMLRRNVEPLRYSRNSNEEEEREERGKGRVRENVAMGRRVAGPRELTVRNY